MSNPDLIEELGNYSLDPLGFVLFAFPWGEPGELEGAHIEPWQEQFLREVGVELRSKLTSPSQIIRKAVTSGHGIGKSALVAWLILWAISTFPDTIGVVTANTETQLKTKTWVQLAKWFRLCLARDLFTMTATKIYSNDPQHEDTWRVDMVPWSERNTEAFAGLHNKSRRILLIFDEGSAIADVIWEVAEGALTDEYTQIIMAAFGNPTRNTGRFRDCFEGGQFAHRWTQLCVDSRQVSLTNKDQIAEWINDYGEDSDFVRVRVKGQFPRIDSSSFIPFDLAREATQRQPDPNESGIVLGVDVARFGDNASVIYPRKGRDAKSIPPRIFFGLDTMALAHEVANAYHELGASIVYVDGGGVGGGVVDRLRHFNIPLIDINFGGRPLGTNLIERGIRYANRRSEMWGAMRDWLADGGCIMDTLKISDMSLIEELAAPSYGLTSKEEILLESKKDMKRRGVKSPDIADALACTFAMPDTFYEMSPYSQPTVAPDFNPYSKENMHV